MTVAAENLRAALEAALEPICFDAEIRANIARWLADQDASKRETLAQALVNGRAGTWEEASPCIVRLSDVKPERVEWLWPERIPCGKLTILDGDPGLGKSALTLDLAARVSTGSPMPDGAPGLLGPAGVVLLSAEDGLADTVRPRLNAAGADAERVVALQYVREVGREGDYGVRLPTVADVTDLEAAIREVGAGLVVVDPLVAYLGSAVDAYRDQDVRAGLAGLADLAEWTEVAVLAVRHLRKSGGPPIYAGGGSIGIIAAARSGLLVAPDPDDPESDRRILATVKCHLARRPRSLAWRVTSTQDDVLRIEWEGESEYDAATLLEREGGNVRTDREAAGEVLRAELAGGPVPISELRWIAEHLDVSWSTVRRASRSIAVVAERVGGVGSDGVWMWLLPDSDGDSSYLFRTGQGGQLGGPDGRESIPDGGSSYLPRVGQTDGQIGSEHDLYDQGGAQIEDEQQSRGLSRPPDSYLSTDGSPGQTESADEPDVELEL